MKSYIQIDEQERNESPKRLRTELSTSVNVDLQKKRDNFAQNKHLLLV